MYNRPDAPEGSERRSVVVHGRGRARGQAIVEVFLEIVAHDLGNLGVGAQTMANGLASAVSC